MTKARLVLWTALFLLVGYGLAHAVECSTCSRNLGECQKPAHNRYVDCMKASNPSCRSKCVSDCQGKKDIQKCTLDCSKSCGGGTSCQAVLASANKQCADTYRACRKSCTR